MKKLLILVAAAGFAAGAVACGGGTSSSDKTATAAAGAKPTSAATVKAAPTTSATTAATKAAEAPTPSKVELAQDVTTLKGIMQQIIAKAQSGDVQGTRTTEATMDKAMEAIVKATRAVDPALADAIEKLELEIEKQADASTTDLAVIIKDAQAVPALLDQVVTTLKLPS